MKNFINLPSFGTVEGENAGTTVKVKGSTDVKSNARTKPAFIEDSTKVQIDPVIMNLINLVVFPNLALYMINSKSC